MNIKSLFIASLAVVLSLALSTSCSKKAVTVHQATVTVKTLGSDCVLWVDNKTVYKPENFSANPFGRQVRAIAIVEDKGIISAPAGSTAEWHSVRVAAIDSILTKKPVESGAAESTNGIEIRRSWTNSFEDGYLTLNFEGEWGESGNPHIINLEKTSDPYTFVLKHDNNGDILRTRLVNGLVAFDLNELNLPAAGSYDLNVAYEGFSKEKVLTFHVVDGTCTEPSSAAGDYE